MHTAKNMAKGARVLHAKSGTHQVDSGKSFTGEFEDAELASLQSNPDWSIAEAQEGDATNAMAGDVGEGEEGGDDASGGRRSRKKR
jgi:hypothetical protein